MIDKQLLYERVQQERQKLVDTMMEIYVRTRQYGPPTEFSYKIDQRFLRRVEEQYNGDLYYGYVMELRGSIGGIE